MSDELQRLSQRVTELETLFTFLQRTVQELNRVVTEQEQRLESIERDLKRAAQLLKQWQPPGDWPDEA
jgi:uncharacterized coiled-coil protein SlyX